MLLNERKTAGGGVSLLQISYRDDRLTLSEYDFGGSREVEYFLSVSGPEDLERLLAALRRHAGIALALPLDDEGLRQVGRSLERLFGLDLDCVRKYRAWLSEQGIVHEQFVQ